MSDQAEQPVPTHVTVTLLLRDGQSVSARMTPEDLNYWSEDFDFQKDKLGSWHAALTSILVASKDKEEIFLEGMDTAYIRHSEDIVGFTMVPHYAPTKAVVRPSPPPSNVGIIFYSVVAVLAIAVVVFIRMCS